MEAIEKLKLAVVDYWRIGMPDLLLIGGGQSGPAARELFRAARIELNLFR